LVSDERVAGQNGSGQNGSDKNVWIKWYTDKMVLNKMVWTKWYWQNGTDKLVAMFCINLNQIEFNILNNQKSQISDKHTEEG